MRGLYPQREEHLHHVSPTQLVDFYYAIGSRYSYLASTQIATLEVIVGRRSWLSPRAHGKGTIDEDRNRGRLPPEQRDAPGPE